MDCRPPWDKHSGLRIYVSPGWQHVQAALANGQQPSEKELTYYERTYKEMAYNVHHTNDTGEQVEQAYAMIPGLVESNFGIHDSKPIRFEHAESYALLTLEYRDLRAAFEFSDPYEIQVNGDPISNWIQEFYCYRAFWNPDNIIFDVGYYHIE